MSRCPYCDCELPGFQTLCDDCYEKRRTEVGKPRSFVETLRKFVANPLAITDQQVMDMRAVPMWAVVCFWCGGLLFCWFGGWAKSRYQFSILSNAVLRGTLLCLAISLALSLALSRRNLHLYWKNASAVFFLISMGVAGHYYIGSNAIRVLAKAIKW